MIVKDKNATPPAYIQAADAAMNQLKALGTDDEVTGICFFHNTYTKDADPRTFDYYRAAAWGKESQCVNAIVNNMENQPVLVKIIARAFATYIFKTVKPDSTDVNLQELRKSLLAYLGEKPDQNPATAEEDAERIFRLVRVKVPERQSQITAYEKYIKDYRKAGLRDIALCIHREISRLRDEITADETRAENERQNANRLRQQMKEVSRVRQQYITERQEQLRLEHDYDSLVRRVRNYRTMIDRLQSEMDALLQQQRDLQQQHPQFDPNSAAKRKRQQLAERKRERAAHKKKGKESLPDTTRGWFSA